MKINSLVPVVTGSRFFKSVKIFLSFLMFTKYPRDFPAKKGLISFIPVRTIHGAYVLVVTKAMYLLNLVIEIVSPQTTLEKYFYLKRLVGMARTINYILSCVMCRKFEH